MGSPTRISAGAWLTRAKRYLHQSENPSLEAQLLLAHVLGQGRTSVMAHLDQALTAAQLEQLDRFLNRLLDGEPLPYLLGRQEFYGLSFIVRPGVLIPRPETELLVDTALEWLRAHPARRQVADVGTGSGCIAAALAVHVEDLQVLAVDHSRIALNTASENFHRLGLSGQVRLVQGDLLSCCAAPFDLICANLPYIPSKDLSWLAVARYEPLSALDGGADGLETIRRLLWDARRWTACGGLLLLEIEANQAESASVLAGQLFANASIEVKNDLSGHARLLTIQL